VTTLWDSVDALVARTSRLDDLVAHGLHLFAAAALRARGAPVPPELEREERAAALRTLAAPLLLGRVREAVDGPLLLVKGPEVASHYPDEALRPYADLDLVVADALAAQRALRAAGFLEVEEDGGKYDDIHHLRPLALPGLPLAVELHDRPKWLQGLRAPTAADLFAHAVPSQVGVDGVLSLTPAEHGVLLAVHSWAHEPLRRVLDLVDVAALGASGEDAAAAWGVPRLWRTTVDAVDAVLGAGGPMPAWAQNLAQVRDRTVAENHLAHWVGPFAALPPHLALAEATRSLVADLRPEAGESWGTKLRRTGRALVSARTRLGEHHAA
jgi:hypothetical protein